MIVIFVFFKDEHIYIILSTDDRQPAGDSRVTGEKANGGYTSCRELVTVRLCAFFGLGVNDVWKQDCTRSVSGLASCLVFEVLNGPNSPNRIESLGKSLFDLLIFYQSTIRLH